MSVLIKNMTMPKNCIECPMQFGGWCYVCPPDIDERVAETVEEAVKQGKPDWCPLVEIEGDDVAPVVHGRWLWMTKKEAASYSSLGFVVDSENWRCSRCNKHGAGRWWARDNKFCPNCGAKMDEREDSDNE